MSGKTCIEEDVLAFLYRVRVKEKNTPELRNDALVLSNRIVESVGGDGEGLFASIRRLRAAVKKNRDTELRLSLDKVTEDRNKLRWQISQIKFDEKKLGQERNKVAQACKKVAEMALARKAMEKTIVELRQRLEPKKRTVAVGRKLAV